MGIGMNFCLPPPTAIPTGSFVIEFLQRVDAQSLITVPSILEDICLIANNVGVDLLSKLQFVAFGGGQLKPFVGEKLAYSNVRLLNHYGTTESGPLAPIFVPDAHYDYRYFRLRSDIDLRLDVEGMSEDGLRLYKLTTRPFGWGTTFEIQDRLVNSLAHPETDFNAVGRKDDMIVLATGEKALPGILENSLLEDERIRAAIAFGEGEFEIGVIVQPSTDALFEQKDLFMESLWREIQRINEFMDAHARISSKEAILIVPASVSLPRSDKGSLMRKEVHKMFRTRIKEVYEQLDDRMCGGAANTFDMCRVEEDLKDMVQSLLGSNFLQEDLSYDADLFELGMDSLQALRLRRLIASALPISADLGKTSRLPRDFIYTHSTISKLAQAIRQPQLVVVSSPISEHDLDQLVDQMAVPASPLKQPIGGHVILLTGATGGLGANLVAHLAELPTVARIICLNRPGSHGDPLNRQLESLSAKGISLEPQATSKIEVLAVDSAATNFGLSKSSYKNLENTMTHTIHVAWPMDFKRQLSSFHSSFRSLHNLVLLSRHAHYARPWIKPRLLFASSIATVGQCLGNIGEVMVPETPMSDSSSANNIGYAKAKLVCERMLERAATDFATEIDVSFIRIGQISGSTVSGFWNKNEHFAALVKTSQSIGKLPELHGVSYNILPVSDTCGRSC